MSRHRQGSTRAAKPVRVASGIYRLPGGGHKIQWRDGGQTRWASFPASVALAHVVHEKAARERLAADAPPATRTSKGQFARDTEAFLDALKHRPCYRSYKTHVKPWVRAFGDLHPLAIDAPMINREAATTFRDYAPNTRRKCLKLLGQILRASLGRKRVEELFADVDVPPMEVGEPEGLERVGGDDLIARVAENLKAFETRGTTRGARTRARFLVRAYCGVRPIQIQRTTPADVVLHDDGTGYWDIPTAKRGTRRRLILNGDMYAAWSLFVAANAWGSWCRRLFTVTLRKAGWPADVSTYRLRHHAFRTMAAHGVSSDDIAQVAGHCSASTAERFYIGAVPAATARATAAIDGRFDASLTEPVSRSNRRRFRVVQRRAS
jgi:hypothetical protein